VKMFGLFRNGCRGSRLTITWSSPLEHKPTDNFGDSKVCRYFHYELQCEIGKHTFRWGLVSIFIYV